MHKCCCGTCRWHELETASSDQDWVCCNVESIYYTDYTDYDGVCPDWEAR